MDLNWQLEFKRMQRSEHASAPASVPHDAALIPELAADLAYLAGYLESVAADGDLNEMRLALRRGSAAIRLLISDDSEQR